MITDIKEKEKNGILKSIQIMNLLGGCDDRDKLRYKDMLRNIDTQSYQNNTNPKML